MAGIIIVDQIQNSSNTGQLTFDNSGNFTTGNLICSGTITGGTGLLNIGSGQIYKDTSGNVGIGTSSPAGKLDIRGASAISYIIDTTAGSAVSSALYLGVPSVTTYAGLVTDYANDRLYIRHNSATRMTLDASGNLGLGVTPSAWATYKALQIGGAGFMGTSSDLNASANAYYNAGWKYYGTGLATLYNQSAGVHSWYNAVSGTAGNAISLIQAMTLDASGNLGVGSTNPQGRVDASGGTTGFYRSSTGGGNYVSTFSSGTSGECYYANVSSTSQYLMRFEYGGNTKGSISTNGTTITYGGTSDYRLKENIANSPSVIDAINAIKVRSFDWISDKSHQDYGFIAQELLEIAPEAVHVPEDEKQMLTVDFGKLTPRLVKAIQEQQELIEKLTARITALESK